MKICNAVTGGAALYSESFTNVVACNWCKAAESTATTTQGTAITINVLANNATANSGALTITTISKPQFSTTITNSQTMAYTPNADFVGNDSFSYIVSDGKGGRPPPR